MTITMNVKQSTIDAVPLSHEPDLNSHFYYVDIFGVVQDAWYDRSFKHRKMISMGNCFNSYDIADSVALIWRGVLASKGGMNG